MCLFEKRTVEEIISICKLEPSTKNIYVEGLSDKLVIDTFLKKQKINDISVFDIDCVDFSEIFAHMPSSELNAPKDSNKEKVAFLALKVEEELGKCHFLSIIDRDLDFVNDHIKSGKYLSYTDYNSMEMYLFSRDYIAALLKNTFRITSDIDFGKFINSIGHVCRSLFYIRAYLESINGSMVDIKKDFLYDKKCNKCQFDLESYIKKVVQVNKIDNSSDTLYEEIIEKVNAPIDDIRLEIKGHDYMKVLYLSVCKHKKVDMNEAEMANTFWVYLDDRALVKEPLFQRICNLTSVRENR